MAKEIYLNDKNFLQQLDLEPVKTLTARVTILSWEEQPICDFTGKVLPGATINIDGSSSMRRTANISLSLDEEEINITNVENIISINKKVKLEIGVDNTLNKYKEFKTIWFPLGTYVIIQPNISRNTGGITVSLQLKDKMCLLNGEVSGILPASVTFNEREYTDADGNEIIENPTLFQIILELVNHFGGEQLGNIIISDLDTRVKKVMKWNSASYPLYRYIYYDGQEEVESIELTMDPSSLPDPSAAEVLSYGQDVGFVYTDFIWPQDDLIGDTGNSVCDILDKIRDLLGNFEYFYDLDGKFIFREIKNYLNTTQATTYLNKLKARDPSQDKLNYLHYTEKEDYQIDQSKGKAEYIFDTNVLISSYTNTPQFNKIKNDFIVWGLRKAADDTTLPIRYHLVIDRKPEIGNTYIVAIIEDEDGRKRALPTSSINSFGDDCEIPEEDRVLGKIYYIENDESTYIIEDENNRVIDDDNENVVVDLLPLDADIREWNFIDDTKTTKGFIKKDNLYLASITTTDWRTELYLQGVQSENLATDSNYYYTELSNEWPKLYDIVEGHFYDDIVKDPSGIDFFLDFIDADSKIGEFCINNIGRRTQAEVDDKVNCVFSIDPYDCIIIDQSAPDRDEQIREAVARNQHWTSVTADVYKNLVQGGNQNSAYSKVRELLYQYTSYCESISLQAIPIYHLDANTRVTVKDSKSNIFGDYMINRITLPLDCSGTMNISATRALDRI